MHILWRRAGFTAVKLLDKKSLQSFQCVFKKNFALPAAATINGASPSPKEISTPRPRKLTLHDSIYWNDPIDENEEKFDKILIANRGEIACRVIKTCRRMGIKTVAIFSEADAFSLHAKLADEAFCVGPPPTGQSYLNIDAILDVIKKTGAQAVHPGYGFLSENTGFAKLLEDNGVSFIGPHSKSIDDMGDKIHSKLIAKKAGVSTIPGFDGVVGTPEECIKIANEIGYPVMIKASAGGGGKGMRIAWNDQEAAEGFRFSTQEAASSFGDSRLLVEKFIENPRHIEVQVLCDKHGNGIYLNERECSIQRRNQKVIEEAPSPFVTPDLRREMGEKAVALAKAVEYDSAGTVEFLMDKNRNFYFLEMNTRLQVEHPITECTTGIDLVHQMIRVAKGHPLSHKQEDIGLKGWSFEARVYAEDPYKNFGLPSIGRLTRYIEPTHLPKVRCDSGIREGSEISIYYDPLICKLVTYGDTREAAAKTMVQALDSYVIRGVTHNVPLLRDIMTEKRFLSGELSTKYLPETYPNGFQGRTLSSHEENQIMAVAAALGAREAIRSNNILNYQIDQTGRSLANPKHLREWNLVLSLESKGGQRARKPVKIDGYGDKLVISIEEQKFNIPKNISLAAPTIELDLDGQTQVVQLISKDGAERLRIQYQGEIYKVEIMTQREAELSQYMLPIPKIDASKIIKSPMPGLVKSVACEVGQVVGEGQEVCVIEAMKMQNSLAVPTDGKVKAIHCKEGDTVEEDQILVELE